MIVALVALSVALAGTAVAGVATISVLDRGEKKQVKKIARKQANKRITKRAPKIARKQANKRITKRAPNLSVASADNAASAANADLLDGRDSNALIRTAFANTAAIALGSGVDGNALTTSISAPTSGFLVMTASSELSTGPVTGDELVCSLVLDGIDLLSADRAVELTTNDNVAFSVNATRQVGAGSHTVSLEAENNDSTTFDNSELNVLFVPFGPTG